MHDLVGGGESGQLRAQRRPDHGHPRARLEEGADAPGEGGGLRGWFRRYQNALWCYVLFAGFLLSLKYLGMLIGGSLFVFLTLTVLGERSLRAHLRHAAIAVASIAFMWSVFTFGLNVILPQGELFSAW